MFDYFFVQNEVSKELLKSININQVVLAGDTRFDRVYALCQNPKELPKIEKFIDNRPCFVIGSSWKDDLDIILPVLKDLKKSLKVIIAPHNISESDIQEVEKLSYAPTIRYTDINNHSDENILIINNMGMLSSVYKMATICHIGGGFRTGLHNTLEAATFGKPIIIGPDYKKFDEVQGLIDAGACFSIKDSTEFSERFETLYNNEEKRDEIEQSLQQHIRAQIGATEKIISYCRQELS